MRLSLAAAAALLLLWGPVTPAAEPDPVGVWPLDPRPAVVTRFDPPTGPYGAGHRGVDLLGTIGEPVRAALPGTVSFTGSIAGVGVVSVDHGTTRTTYQPVAASLPVGTAVGAGAVIGVLQPGGSHCPPRACLHWGWIEGETYLDPLRLVGAGPVRLLPWWHPPEELPTVPAAPAVPRGATGLPSTAPPLDPRPTQARGWAWR